MKLLLDTNILVDFLDNSRENHDYATKVLELCMSGLVGSYVPSFSFVNLVYIVCERLKIYNLKEIRTIYQGWRGTIQFMPMEPDDLARGFEMGFSDYEDALQAIIAERVGARYIVTWNKRDYAKSPVRAITPKELFQDIIVGMKI